MEVELLKTRLTNGFIEIEANEDLPARFFKKHDQESIDSAIYNLKQVIEDLETYKEENGEN